MYIHIAISINVYYCLLLCIYHCYYCVLLLIVLLLLLLSLILFHALSADVEKEHPSPTAHNSGVATTCLPFQNLNREK